MSEDGTLDAILAEIGDFGRYQKRNFLLICFSVLFSIVNLSYIFIARDLNYRCKVERCDTNTSKFNATWVPFTIPFNGKRPSRCETYRGLSFNQSESQLQCNAYHFDTNQTTSCTSFIYETEDITIVHDFDLHCDENLWKLTLIGTVSNIGHFFCLPIAGFISDRYGRRTLLVSGLAISALFGFLRSFSPSYLWYITLEFLDTCFGSAAFSCAFILGVELVGPKKRVLVGAILSSAFAAGETLIALIAWAVPNWRLFLRIIYPPGFLFLLYFWCCPESVRWLLAKGRKEEAIQILRKAAKTNGKEISPFALEKLSLEEDNNNGATSYPILQVFKSYPLVTRLAACSFCWITCTFLFYGLSINSVTLSGNHYLNFIMTSLVEIPAYCFVYVVVNRLGRRFSQFIAFIITGLSCFAFMFIPEENGVIKLIVYLIGKFGATLAFTVIYIFTSEMFPTSLRHSLLATCSMLGRIGSIVAPQIPILAYLWKHLPAILFGSMATAAALLSLTFPETVNVKLPDTIEEAEIINKLQNKNFENSER